MNRYTAIPMRKSSTLCIWRRLSMESLETRFAMDGSSAFGGLTQSGGDAASGSVGMVGQETVSSLRLAFRIEVTDFEDRPLTAIQTEDEFYLKVYVEDLRDLPKNALSIFSAYVNIGIDWNRFALAGRPRLGGDFWDDDPLWTANETSSYSGLLAGFGGIFVQRRAFGTPLLLAWIPLRAISEGESMVSLGPVDDSTEISRSTALYGVSEPLKVEEIEFGSKSLTVLPKGSTSSGGEEVSEELSGGQAGVSVPWVPLNTASPLVAAPVVVIPSVPVNPIGSVTFPLVSQVIPSPPLVELPSVSLPVEGSPMTANPVMSQGGSSLEAGSRAFQVSASGVPAGLGVNGEWGESEVEAWSADAGGELFLSLIRRAVVVPLEGLVSMAAYGVMHSVAVRSMNLGGPTLAVRDARVGISAGEGLTSPLASLAMGGEMRRNSMRESSSLLRISTTGTAEDWRSDRPLRGVGSDVASRILARVEWLPLSKGRERAFEWEATYIRRSLSRIPFEHPEVGSRRIGEVGWNGDRYVDIGRSSQAISDWRVRADWSDRERLGEFGSEVRLRVPFPLAFEGGALRRLTFDDPLERTLDEATWHSLGLRMANVGDSRAEVDEASVALGALESLVDASLVETSLLETSLLETSLLDASLLDASLLDASLLDASLLETSLLEASWDIERMDPGEDMEGYGGPWGSWVFYGVAGLGWVWLYGIEEGPAGARCRSENSGSPRGWWPRWDQRSRRVRG